MVTQVIEISTPPTPADPPAEFEQKAAQVWSELHQAVPQLNQQAAEIEQIGADAEAAKERAITEADLALGYSNQAGLARDAAQQSSQSAGVHASDAVASAQAAGSAKDDATEAAAQAAAHAADMGQAVAMAATFTSVPLTFQAWCIAVTQPHLRLMIWSGTKYVRAPWHQPGELSYFLRNVPAGSIEVRSDIVLNKSDFPDLAEYLGVTVATFVLDETRGEFLRTLDSGRGVDAARVVATWQEDMFERHSHPGVRLGPADGHSGNAYLKSHAVSGTTDETGGDETRPRNIAFRLAVKY